MTQVFEVSVEAEPVEASHLLRTRCSACGTPALAAPGRERVARCAACWGGSVVVPELAGRYGAVPARWARDTSTRVPEVARVAYPAPEVTSRSAEDGRRCAWPAAVEKLAQRARAASWDVVMAYSRGCLPLGATGAPGAVRDVFSVRCLRQGWGAYATYLGGTGAKWDSVMLWGDVLPWFPSASVTDLGQFLADPARPAAWFDAIRDREADKARRTKLRAACNVGRHDRARWIEGGVWCWWCPVCLHGWSSNQAPWRKLKQGKEGA